MKLTKFLFVVLLIPTLFFAQDSIQPKVDLKVPLDSKIELLVSAPVVLKSDTLFFLQSTTNHYPIELRAEELSNRLEKITSNYNSVEDSLSIVTEKDFVAVKYNNEIAFIVTGKEAKNNSLSMLELAELRKRSLYKSLNNIESLSLEEWLKRIGYFIVFLLLLVVIIKLINWFFKKIKIPLSKIEKTFLKKNKNILKYLIPRGTANIFVLVANIFRIGIIAIILLVYAPFMFSFFPLAEGIAKLFYGYISTPVKYVFYGFINFIPNIFFILIIAFVARFIVRVGREIATDVETGKFKIRNFHQDWASPTGKIFSIFVYAVSLIMIFPYLPGSGSSAFQGVSIFIGAIISFGSSSAIANIIAGVVITYMRPFQIGDRVRIDNIVGSVINKTILVTHLRTAKNEDVTIPNANILVGNIINYSNSDGRSVILHTTITLGYDLPWQTAHKLLLAAADKTALLEKKPKPFILQTSLDDYYVSYELNFHIINKAEKIPFIYSEVHKNILEVFNEAGVEILSPAYMAARDGSLTTVPSQLKSAEKSPIKKIVDHLTGQNQKVVITKPTSNSDE